MSRRPGSGRAGWQAASRAAGHPDGGCRGPSSGPASWCSIPPIRCSAARACRVRRCGRDGLRHGLCQGHHQRWVKAGPPRPGVFAATAGPWHGQRAAGQLPGRRLRFRGAAAPGLCQRHLGAWDRAGEPDIDDWLASVPPRGPAAGQAACRVSFCQRGRTRARCCAATHHRRWKALGGPDLAGFLAGWTSGPPAPTASAHDLTALPAQLRLEVQYALQCRRDERAAKTKPARSGPMVRWLAASGAVSLLDRSEQAWRNACSAPYRQDAAQPGRAADLRPPHGHHLAEGQGWDNEYPRDTWQLRRLGIDPQAVVTLQFTAIRQPWLKDLAKRWTRWRLWSGLVAGRLLPRRARHHPVRRVPAPPPGSPGPGRSAGTSWNATWPTSAAT